MIDQTKLAHLIDRTIGSKGQKLKKQNEYMYWSPFVSHHKPKLQINIITGKWHCWVSDEGGHNLFQLFKKLNSTNDQFTELRGIVDETSYGYESKEVKKNGKVELPKEFAGDVLNCLSIAAANADLVIAVDGPNAKISKELSNHADFKPHIAGIKKKLKTINLKNEDEASVESTADGINEILQEAFGSA